MPPKLVVLTGPTATGKTALSIELARALGGEIVSADSMQIYRFMDIGTAKPTVEERSAVPHHMIDIVDPSEDYSVSRYAEEAAACADEILARGKLPIVTGGTGQYIEALLRGTDFAPAPPEELREAIGRRYDAAGGAAMLNELASRDPVTAAKLHPNDKKRIVRAFEVLELSGFPISEHDAQTRRNPPRYEAARISLSFQDRDTLYAHIDRRVDAMFQAGLLDEAEALLRSGIPDTATSMQAIGYKESAAALRGEISVPEAVEQIKRGSRRYAKRQLTWLRRVPEVHWVLWEREPDFAAGLRNSTSFLENAGIM